MYSLKLEKQYLQQHEAIGGIDEAGRGPLAGPVVAACVVMDRGFRVGKNDLYSVRDSKKLSSKQREDVCKMIMAKFPAIGIGICDHQTIDSINVLQATWTAMKKAIAQLAKKPGHILVDGNKTMPNINLSQTCVISGDNKVFLIAAASIVAKVTRDRLMLAYHTEYPEYGFDRHKGYCTKEHLKNLACHGPCLIHRRSFSPVRSCVDKLSKPCYPLKNNL